MKHTTWNRKHRRRSALAALTAGIMTCSLIPFQAAAYWDPGIDPDDVAGYIAEDDDDMMPSVTYIQGSLPGDVNDDGEVSVIDVIIVQGWLLGHDNITMFAPENGDIDGDGTIDIFDLALLKRIVIGNGTAIMDIGDDEPEDPTDEPEDPTDEPENPTETKPQMTDGKIFQKIALKDTMIGVDVFEGVLPDGWTVELASDWGHVGTIPGQELVRFVSPDGKASVQIASPTDYEQSNLHQTGVDYSCYMTFFPYMNASDFTDYYTQLKYGSATLEKDIAIPSEQEEAVSAYALASAQGFQNVANATGAPFQVTGYEGTVSRRQYKTDSGYAEFCAAVSGYEFTYTTGITQVVDVMWQTLDTVAFEAESKEAFDQYYSDYEIITANGYFTAALYSANEYVSSRIANMIAEARTSSSASGAASDYFSSGAEVNESNAETQERVFQAWDDYIKDEDRYTTTDGNTLITSMYYDTVAQDGDYFYAGTTAGVPEGYTILNRQEP